MLHGLAFALPGAFLFWWHLREARRREAWPRTPLFWGRSLYYHLVAFVSLWFAVVGIVTILSAAADFAAPDCAYRVAPVAEPDIEASEPPPVECYPQPSEAGRRALDGAIFVLAAGPVWGWHLRQGQRATQPGPSDVPAFPA